MHAYYQMSRKRTADGTIVFKRSHKLFQLKTGRPLAKGFTPPFIVELDDELPDGSMPTFYESPAVIGTKAFYQDLVNAGVSNIETVPVVIKNPVSRKDNNDYLLLNIVGRVQCLDMQQSKHRSLGPGMTVVDEVSLKPGIAKGLDLFVADEDTDVIIVSERVHRHIVASGYDDVWFKGL